MNAVLYACLGMAVSYLERSRVSAWVGAVFYIDFYVIVRLQFRRLCVYDGRKMCIIVNFMSLESMYNLTSNLCN